MISRYRHALPAKGKFMTPTRIRGCLFNCLLLIATSACASADAPKTGPASKPDADDMSLPGTVWINPIIKDYGRVHPRADAAAQPDPNADYKVIVDVVHGSKEKSEVSGSLQRLARLVNLMGFAKVPPEHVHIVAVLEGEAGFAAANNAVYRKHFKTDNPNLKLLHELKLAGVDLLVCGQALAENGLVDADVGPDITVSLSALSDFAVYGQRGYSYMQL
jgi:intracellular sulfur oxidation DsrE/DsrF family protein